MLRLRPFKHGDAAAILSWSGSERDFCRWCADTYDKYPITEDELIEKYDSSEGYYPMTAFDESGIAGHLMLCYADPAKTTVRVCFVIVDHARRSQGIGREMISLAVKYAADFLGAEKITLGVFEDNPAARKCYESAGFEYNREKDRYYHVCGEDWLCLDMVYGGNTKKKLLVTAFEPFGEDMINSAERAVAQLPETIGEWEIHKAIFPVVFGKAAECAIRAAEECSADAVLCIGQAGGRDAVTPEMIAINLMHARIADNGGNQPLDLPIRADGPAAYFSTLPIRRMAEAGAETGVSVRVSYSAGTFVCNDIYYRLLDHYAKTDVRVGFVHVPYCEEQGEPHINTSETARTLIKIIEAMGE